MKKLLMSSVILLIFSLSISLFQLSCTKSSDAQTDLKSTTTLGIILYAVGNDGQKSNGSASSYWTMNIDGTNQKQIPITFNSKFQYTMHPRLSPDGKTVYFSTSTGTPPMNSVLYSCSIDGTNLKTLLTAQQTGGGGADIEVGGVY